MNLNRRFLSLMLITMLAATLGVTPSAAQDSITRVVWDLWSRDVDSADIDQLHEEFMEAHPGVTIQREVYDLFDLMAIQPLAFSEAGGPDVSMINQGYVGTGTLVEAGLLMPLNDYADQYGWWDRYAMGLHARNSFSADGKQFGVGNL